MQNLYIKLVADNGLEFICPFKTFQNVPFIIHIVEQFIKAPPVGIETLSIEIPYPDHLISSIVEYLVTGICEGYNREVYDYFGCDFPYSDDRFAQSWLQDRWSQQHSDLNLRDMKTFRSLHELVEAITGKEISHVVRVNDDTARSVLLEELKLKTGDYKDLPYGKQMRTGFRQCVLGKRTHEPYILPEYPESDDIHKYLDSVELDSETIVYHEGLYYTQQRFISSIKTKTVLLPNSITLNTLSTICESIKLNWVTSFLYPNCKPTKYESYIENGFKKLYHSTISTYIPFYYKDDKNKKIRYLLGTNDNDNYILCGKNLVDFCIQRQVDFSSRFTKYSIDLEDTEVGRVTDITNLHKLVTFMH